MIIYTLSNGEICKVRQAFGHLISVHEIFEAFLHGNFNFQSISLDYCEDLS